MYDINKVLEIFKNYVNSRTVLEPPTKAEIIDKLCTFGVDDSGIDNTDKVNKIIKSVINSVKKYENFFQSRNKEVNIKFLCAINGGYQIVKVFFNEDCIPSTLEGINIYIPVKGDKLVDVIPNIYKHLLSNRMSFSSKISMFNRSDNLVVEVYNKDDAISLINFCNGNFSDCLGMINPFIARLGNVGVSREISGYSYNRGIAVLLNEYIEECILKQRVKPYDAIDFQNFVNEMYESANNYIDKNMYYVASTSLYCILTNDNILKYLKSNIELIFDYDNYYRYEEVNVTGENEYLYSGKVINEDTDYICFVKLQALNCLNKIYEEEYNTSFARNTKVSNKFTCKLLEQLDYILKLKGSYNIKISYKNEEIHKLLPYLYAFVAYKYKSCNIDEVKKLIDLITKTMIIEKGIYDNKYYYIEDNGKIISSVPIINMPSGSIVIDVIDESSMMSNITIIRKGIKEKFLNVYIKVDYDLLKDNHTYQGRCYRYKVGRLLLDNSRNKEALELRKKDFSALFLNV